MNRPAELPHYRTPTPPLSAETSALHPAAFGTRLKKAVAMLLSGAFFFGLVWGAGYLFDVSWLQTTGYVLGGLIGVIGILIAATAKVAECPYCRGQLGTTVFDTLAAGDENEQLECGHCFEWLVSHQGQVRAFGPDDGAKRETFEAPVFNGGVWPDECICCGAPPVRFDEARKTKVELSALLVASLSVASASIKGIPYCDDHKDAVAMDVKDDHPRLVFEDYDARRAYVALNQGKKPAKIKG